MKNLVNILSVRKMSLLIGILLLAVNTQAQIVIQPRPISAGGSFSNPLLAPSSSDCTTPYYAFAANTTTGLARIASGSISNCASGSEVGRFNSDGLNVGTNLITFGSSITGTPDVKIYRTGTSQVTIASYASGDTTFDVTGSLLIRGNNPIIQVGGTNPCNLYPTGSYGIDVRNGTNACQVNIYKTYTDASNYERFSIGLNVGGVGATTWGIGSVKLGTGAARSIALYTDGSLNFFAGGTNVWSISSGGSLQASAGTNISFVAPAFIRTAPTVSSGFGSSPSIAANNGTAAFTINVGTGGTASSGVIGLPAATTGWVVTCVDQTTPGVNVTKQTGNSTTTATVTNYNSTTGIAAAWTASDVLYCQATAF
jgi:hypothetical protein